MVRGLSMKVGGGKVDADGRVITLIWFERHDLPKLCRKPTSNRTQMTQIRADFRRFKSRRLQLVVTEGSPLMKVKH
jgi:hypothetical protein